jgi:tRNA(Ile)-lysidine synthase TilS/MesJ
MLLLLDRRGGLHALVQRPGDTVAVTLLRNAIPPTSVLTFCDDSTIVADDHVLDPNSSYTAKLIEGYDIAGIRRLFDSRDSSKPYVRRRLALAANGSLDMERTALDVPGVAEHVEDTVRETIELFRLLTSTDAVVLGLSGGVDSGSLLMLLAAYRDVLAPDLEIHAATFQDFDSKWSKTFDFARKLADRHTVSHRILEPGYAEDVFHLNRPLAQILMYLMETEDAHVAMYVDHHTTRRVLEAHADTLGTSTVALGLHTTDLLAGLMNSHTLGFDTGGIPDRVVGPYTYVFPLAFVPKRELHLYYLHKTGHAPKQTEPNQWEFNPGDRNFLYYLADQLQWQWPGIEAWMFTAHAKRVAQETPRFLDCQNCGASVRDQPDSQQEWRGTCDVCEVLDKHGWVSR